MADEPDSHLAARVLPGPLYRALKHVFAQGVADALLVGGTALAGYYAGHRRSDDLYLFVRDTSAFQAMVHATESSRTLGCTIEPRQRTAQFFDATCELSGHSFAVQVVIDARLFDIGQARRADDGVVVAELTTILKQKAATLVSRCSEKDLYDLQWLFRHFPTLQLESLMTLGAEVDAGMTAESVMLSLTGTTLRKSACGFARDETADAVFQGISDLKRALAERIDKLARKQEVGPVGELVRTLRR